MFLLFVVMGNFVLILKVFTSNQIFQIGLPFVLVMVNYMYRKQIYNVFREINIAVSNYAEDIPINLGMVSAVVFTLLLASVIIKLYVCSEEEYWHAD